MTPELSLRGEGELWGISFSSDQLSVISRQSELKTDD